MDPTTQAEQMTGDGAALEAAPVVEVAAVATTLPPVVAPSPVPIAEITAAVAAEQAGPDPQQAAATALAEVYRAQSGIVPALIGGATVAEVQASYTRAQEAYQAARTAVLQEQGAAVPPARGGVGVAAIPSSPLGMIALAVQQAGNK